MKSKNPATRRRQRKRRKERQKQAKRIARIRASEPRYDYESWLRWRGCEAKSTYPDEEAAIHGCITMSARYGEPMRAYRCEYCGRWHITTSLDDGDEARAEESLVASKA